ncbi:MAG: hypothetical protein QM775_27050 [Pirellulales bacterium]
MRSATAKQPTTAEQVRAKYESDRVLQTAIYALKGDDWKRGRQLVDQAQQQLQNAGLLDDERRRQFALIDAIVAFGLGEADRATVLIVGYAEELAELPPKEQGDLTFCRAFAALCRFKAGDIPAALTDAKAAIERYRTAPPKGGDPELLPAMWMIVAADAHRQGDKDAAAMHQRAACQAYVDAKAAKTPEYGEALELLGRFELSRKDYAAARRAYDEALETFESTVGRDDPRTKQAAEHLATLVDQLASFDRQKALIREYGEVSKRRDALDVRKNPDEHRELIERELEIARSLPGLPPDDLFGKLWEVGDDRIRRKDYAGAEQLFAGAQTARQDLVTRRSVVSTRIAAPVGAVQLADEAPEGSEGPF